MFFIHLRSHGHLRNHDYSEITLKVMLIFEAEVYLLRLFMFTSDFEHFLFEYWTTFYHEYFHLFLERRCGIKYSEKTINKLVARLLLFLNVMADIAESRKYFCDLNTNTRESSSSFVQQVAHCMFMGYYPSEEKMLKLKDVMAVLRALGKVINENHKNPEQIFKEGINIITQAHVGRIAVKSEGDRKIYFGYLLLITDDEKTAQKFSEELRHYILSKKGDVVAKFTHTPQFP